VVAGVGEQELPARSTASPVGPSTCTWVPGYRFPKLVSELPLYPEIPVPTTGVAVTGDDEVPAPVIATIRSGVRVAA